MRNIPKGLSEIPQIPTYSPIGLAMNFEYFPIEAGKEIEIPLPFTNTQITNGTECFLVVRKDGSYAIVQPTSMNGGYLTVPVDSSVASVMLMQKVLSGSGSIVAYLDEGMVYSNDNRTSVSTSITLRNCLPEFVNGAQMKLFYTDISDPFNPVNDTALFTFDTMRVNGNYILQSSDQVWFTGTMKVTGITIEVPQCSVSYTDSSIYNISRGQKLTLSCDWDIDKLGSIEAPLTASYEINYALESVSIDGEGRILQHRSGDSVFYSYDYYLKDHLGSTRMVINDQNSITEKIAYQAYGSINSLDSSSPALPSREKFTSKEFDTQGADFARVEFDITVRDFDMSSGSGFIRASYKDVTTGNSFSKIYKTRYDSKNRSLRFTGSESFTGEVEIEQMFLMASGVPGGIFNIVPIDSFLVSVGKTRKIQLDVASSEIIGTPIDTNLYSVHAAVDNSSYFSGTRLFYFGARYYDPELGIWLSVDSVSQFANAYAYAGNGANPVIMVDKDGNFIFSTLSLVIIGVSAAISGTMTAVKVADAGGNFGQVMAGFVIGSAAGAVGGALGTITGGAATAGVNAALGAFSSTFAGGLIGATVGGAAGGAVGGAASGLVGGTFTSIAMHQDFDASIRSGLISMVNGIATGAVTGAAAGAAGYGVGKGVETLRNARNAGGQPTALAKSAQKTDVNFVKEVSNAGADKSLELTVDGPIQSNTNAPDYNPNNYYKITNPLQPQTPTIKLPVAPTNVPTNGVQMPPLNINPLPQGVTPAGNGGFYMITPNTDFYYSF